MKKTSNRSTAGRLGTVTVAAALVVLSVLLAGCSNGYEELPPQSYDTEYDVFSVLSSSGNLSIFVIKAFESGGKVALCGGYTRGVSSFSKMGNRQWADVSQIYIDDKKIGTAAFMSQMPVYGLKDGEDPKAMFIALQEKDPALPCVRSKAAWKASYENAKVERRGPNRIRVFD